MSNPYTLLFGKPPVEIIERRPQEDYIISSFTSDIPVNQINMISGIRGSGKTVFMTDLANRFREMSDWIVIDLNPDRDLLTSLAARLYSEKRLAGAFSKAKLNLSFFGFGVEIDGEPPIVDIEEAVSRMLESVKRVGKKVLITIDEVSNTKDMRAFVSAFQIFVRNDLPVFLLMTGLYKNINRLRNSETLTFLERSPRTELAPLELTMIAENYMESLGVEQDTAIRLAQATKGYSFAFQVIGYYAWENAEDFDDVIEKAYRYLEEFSYNKIWSELSEIDRRLLIALSKTPDGEISKIRKLMNYTTNQFNPYRDRLKKEGLISCRDRGRLAFLLPGFDRYVLKREAEESGMH